MSRKSYPVSKRGTSLFANVENILILEKSLEQNGQDWIENLNVIEQVIIRIVDRIGQDHPILKSNFVIRRLPTYLAPYINKNEYGIVLEALEYTLIPRTKTRQKSSTDKPGTSNFGQIEIFQPIQACSTEINSSPPAAVDDIEENDEEIKNSSTQKPFSETTDILNENYAYRSHEIFKRFAAAFVDAYQSECERIERQKDLKHEPGKVQLIGPHLLLDVRHNPEVQKIFTLTESHAQMNAATTSKCSVNVNYLKSLITITYEDTEAVIRPCQFHEKGYPRVNGNVSERLPIHNPSFLTIGESLTKGFLLFPTSFETLWTLQLWPAESHLISIYHPGSIVSRVFKLYASYCLNPLHFWETLNSCFLVGLDEMDSFVENCKVNLLTADFLLSSFAYELEHFCEIEDWAPRNFSTRLMHLVRTAVDCYDKGFHMQYYTKINVLRGIWKNSDHFEKEEKSVLRELDDITESQENLEDYGDQQFMEINDLEDDFGFQFEDLETIDDEDIKPRLTSETIYKSLNPFQSCENLPSGSQIPKTSSKKPKTLSKMFGSNLMRKFSNKVTRRHSDAGARDDPSHSNIRTEDKMRSMTDIASGFEESIAQMRRHETLQQQRVFQDDSIPSTGISETSFYKNPYPKTSYRQPTSSKAVHQHETLELESTPESVYSILLQTLNDIPSSDYLSDQEMIVHLEQSRKTLESQEELISSWSKAISELPKPKHVCPHVFSPRQIQYLSLVIQMVSQCSPNMIKMIKSSKMPSWEISGDILRTVLYQMRTEVADSESLKEKQRHAGKKYNLKSGDQDETKESQKSGSSRKFSLRRSSSPYSCKHQDVKDKETGENEADGDAHLALEEPETAATHRLLEWLWQLRCSEIGRLSSKANKYMEELYKTSLVNCHFLEQFSEDRMFKTMALKSAMAVTRIMGDDKFPAHVPLYAATTKGWPWAEMILSLASWNKEKGVIMKANIPLSEPDPVTKENYLLRTIDTTTMADPYGSLKKKSQTLLGSSEPDLDAATLAFHSELATPIGWNDFEDPRSPGPYTVVILIFSSMGYYKLWEMAPGNVVQVLVRLQKFNSLQHVGSMLSAPHRKTALSEVRKLNKSLSFRIYNFDDNVMSKTFKRLASLRNTRRKLLTGTRNVTTAKRYSCGEIGCKNYAKPASAITTFRGMEFECTKL